MKRTKSAFVTDTAENKAAEEGRRCSEEKK
jgi:hypothetical protein